MVVWAVDGSGPAGGCSCGKGQLIVSRGFVARGCGWLSVVGIGNTPAAAWFGWWWAVAAVVVVVVCWWWVSLACVVRVGVACCRGSGVVRPGCLACGSASLLWGGVVGVGGLVVNCIVDASIITVCFCDCGMWAFLSVCFVVFCCLFF